MSPAEEPAETLADVVAETGDCPFCIEGAPVVGLGGTVIVGLAVYRSAVDGARAGREYAERERGAR